MMKFLELQLRWLAQSDGSQRLYAGRLLLGDVRERARHGRVTWEAHGSLFAYQSSGHPTREAAQAALEAGALTTLTSDAAVGADYDLEALD